MQIRELLSFFEQWAPSQLAEDYDNVGLLVGKPEAEITGVLVSLDSTEEVVDEAIARNCNVIVSHHPILFKGLKKLNGQNYVARCVEKAIRNGVALVAVHTNLDHIQTGVNHQIAQRLGLNETRVLRPLKNQLMKLEYFIPPSHHEKVLESIHAAGAGNIGKYSECSFSTSGKGRFTPNEGSNPFSGTIGQPQESDELKVEVIFPKHSYSRVMKALTEAHPYEEVACMITSVENEWQDAGAGMIGMLPEPLSQGDWLNHLKMQLSVSVVKYTKPIKDKVQTIALCGGSGFFLLSDAKAAGADVFVTADVKYHEFFDAEDRIQLMDIGHFESEQFTSSLIIEKLSIQFPNIAVLLSETKTNPVFYA
jgi:dinuclear metal center YbgI/SA1388 family protein